MFLHLYSFKELGWKLVKAEILNLDFTCNIVPVKWSNHCKNLFIMEETKKDENLRWETKKSFSSTSSSSPFQKVKNNHIITLRPEVFMKLSSCWRLKSRSLAASSICWGENFQISNFYRLLVPPKPENQINMDVRWIFVYFNIFLILPKKKA